MILSMKRHNKNVQILRDNGAISQSVPDRYDKWLTVVFRKGQIFLRFRSSRLKLTHSTASKLILKGKLS